VRGDRRAASARHEAALRARGYARIAGVDEVGRGCLAGPVVAAAVVLDPERPVPGLRDSKQIGPAERARLARVVVERAAACGLGVVDAEEIDRLDILRATLKAMTGALGALRRRPDFVLVDALRIPGIAFPQRSLVRGDQKVACIAAASIVAKVYRDGLMSALDVGYPGYGFAAHKGYGTASHLRALALLGASPQHRRTFHGVGSPIQLSLPSGSR
jgi:ribonuclease HII